MKTLNHFGFWVWISVGVFQCTYKSTGVCCAQWTNDKTTAPYTRFIKIRLAGWQNTGLSFNQSKDPSADSCIAILSINALNKSELNSIREYPKICLIVTFSFNKIINLFNSCFTLFIALAFFAGDVFNLIPVRVNLISGNCVCVRLSISGYRYIETSVNISEKTEFLILINTSSGTYVRRISKASQRPLSSGTNQRIPLNCRNFLQTSTGFFIPLFFTYFLSFSLSPFFSLLIFISITRI